MTSSTNNSNKLNILTVGTNPNLVYYSHKFQKTGKFNIFYINEDLTISKPIILKDNALHADLELETKIVASSFTEFNTVLRSNNKLKFDIVFLSSKSLQELSNIASYLTPFLNKSSILILESTGSVHLEPYLKNIPQFKELHLAVFSIVSTIDIRKTPISNEYINLTDLKTREVYIGEAQISPSKYGKGPQQNLGALTKLFSMENKDSLRVIIKPTHQEFLTEQWKHAIPQICFNPLLILFEESSPLKLTEQILAKPLLSGLVTELITVCKSMGCKLPLGFDNESNLLKSWVDSNLQLESIISGLKFTNSPKLFYDYYNSNPLDIDMILLQPILLADDYGIKTPYLEFLYATLCRLEKMNYSSVFFLRRESANAQILENQRIAQELYEAKGEIEELKQQNEEKSGIVYAQLEQEKNNSRQLQSKLTENFKFIQSLELNQQQHLSAFEGTKVELNTVKQELEQAKVKIQQLQEQLQRRSVSPLKGSKSSVNLLQATLNEPQQYSDNGTPDLRDLRDAALISAQFASSSPRASKIGLDQADISTSTVIQQQQQHEDEEANVSVSNIGNESSLSLKESELAKKEQMLAMRELEFNKKLQRLHVSQQQPSSITQNTVFSQHPMAPQQGLQPALQPRLKHHHSGLQLNVNQQQQFPMGPQSPSMPQGNGQFPTNGNFRRINSGMIMDAESYNQFRRGGQQQMNGPQFGQGPTHQVVVRKADRKNRKSSMTLSSTANFQMDGGVPQQNNGQRRSTMNLAHPGLMGGNSFTAGMNAGSIVANGNTYLQKQQHQQFNSGRIQAPQPSMAMKPQAPHFQMMNSSRSSSNGIGATDNLTTPPSSEDSQQQAFQKPNRPQVYKSASEGAGYITPSSNNSGGEDDYEVKPLGAIAGVNKDINYSSNKEKKKFGLFGKSKN